MQSFIEQFEHTLASAPDGDRRFFEPSQIPWVGKVEAHWQAIRQEVVSLLGAVEMLPGFEDIQREQSELSNDRHWKIFPFYAYGQTFEQNLRRCPRTREALMEIVGLKAAMFSVLRAGKVLPPHRGPYKGVLRYHLGIVVPAARELCAIQVGGEVAHWADGQSLVFDDSYEHSAWNRSTEDRVVLFVDFVRPLPPEMAAVNELIINEIEGSSFITDTAENWQAWEAAYGRQLDEVLGC